MEAKANVFRIAKCKSFVIRLHVVFHGFCSLFESLFSLKSHKEPDLVLEPYSK